MQIGYATVFRPTKTQATHFRQWIGSARIIWNSKIKESEYFYSFGSKFVPLTQWCGSKGNPEPEFAFVDKKYSQFKNDELTPWLSDCPSQILRNSATNWYETQWKFMRGECGAPKIKHKSDGGSVWLTNELFTINEPLNRGEPYRIWIGTKTKPLGFIDIKWNKMRDGKFPGKPNSITIRVDQWDRWHVSFSFDDGTGQTADQKEMQREWLKHLKERTREELLEMTEGLDRGVVIPVASTTKDYGFTVEEKNSLKLEKEKRTKWQKKLARQVKGSKRSLQTKFKISKTYTKQSNIRKDRAHKTTHEIIRKTDKKVFVLEALSVKGMTGSAAGTIEKPGTNVSQKSGLNREILNVGWGMIQIFLTYKALREGKIVFKVNPKHTSQECSNCGHTHQANRREQSEFVCQSCGHAENADRNASKVIRNRAVNFILNSGTELSDDGVLRLKSDKGRQSSKTKSRVLKDSNSRQKRSAA